MANKDIIGLAISSARYGSKAFQSGGIPPAVLQGPFQSGAAAQRAGAHDQVRFLALDIHPIVGTQRYRYGNRQSARVSVKAKSIAIAKAEVGKVEIKTTDG